MDYICKRKNNIQSISITADRTGPRDKEGSQLAPPWLLPFPQTLLPGSRGLGPETPPILSVWEDRAQRPGSLAADQPSLTSTLTSSTAKHLRPAAADATLWRTRVRINKQRRWEGYRPVTTAESGRLRRVAVV